MQLLKKLFARMFNHDLYVQMCWDEKSDDDIRVAYNDAKQWLATEPFITLPKSLKEQLENKLINYINPQIVKRKLEV